jgi:hypothetical protein
MAMTNAERQRAWRARKREVDDAGTEDFAPIEGADDATGEETDETEESVVE